MAIIETYDSGVANGDSVWHKFTIIRVDGEATIKFYIDDVLVATHVDTTSFATGAYGMDPTIYGEKIAAGTDSNIVSIDYFDLRITELDRTVV